MVVAVSVKSGCAVSVGWAVAVGGSLRDVRPAALYRREVVLGRAFSTFALATLAAGGAVGGTDIAHSIVGSAAPMRVT